MMKFSCGHTGFFKSICSIDWLRSKKGKLFGFATKKICAEIIFGGKNR